MPHTFFESVIFLELDDTPITELADVTCPWPAPKMVRKTGNKVTKMRDGVDGAGFRIAKLSKVSDSDFDLPMEVEYMTDAQHGAIQGLEESDEAFQVSIDSGATFYRACLQDDGYTPKPWDIEFTRAGASIRLHILGLMA